MQEAPTTCFESSSFFDFLLGFALALGTFGALTFGSFLEGMLGWLAEPPVSSDALEVFAPPSAFSPCHHDHAPSHFQAQLLGKLQLQPSSLWLAYATRGTIHITGKWGAWWAWRKHENCIDLKSFSLVSIESCSARISFPGGMSSKSMALRTAFKGWRVSHQGFSVLIVMNLGDELDQSRKLQ